MRTPTAALLQLTLTTLLVSLSVSTVAASSAAAATADAATGACAGTSGVSVVVDLTDLGGDVVVGCAAGDPATGRQALLDAGFVVTDATTGMICTINSAPDPCPVTFAGSYWSYWSAQPGADWTAYAVGADSSDPAPGAFEGWRYNDGSVGPSVLPAALEAAAPTAATTPTPGAAAPVADDSGTAGPSTATITGLGVAALLLVAAVGVVISRRRRVIASTSGETGETGD